MSYARCQRHATSGAQIHACSDPGRVPRASISAPNACMSELCCAAHVAPAQQHAQSNAKRRSDLMRISWELPCVRPAVLHGSCPTKFATREHRCLRQETNRAHTQKHKVRSIVCHLTPADAEGLPGSGARSRGPKWLEAQSCAQADLACDVESCGSGKMKTQSTRGRPLTLMNGRCVDTGPTLT